MGRYLAVNLKGALISAEISTLKWRAAKDGDLAVTGHRDGV
jgi:hypothetical protein